MLQGTTRRRRRRPAGQETFANQVSDKGMVKGSRIHRELNATTGRQTAYFKKRVKDLNRRFSKGDTQVASEHMKRFSTSSLIQKMETKTIIRYHLARTRKARIKKQNKPTPENDACWGGCGSRKPVPCWWGRERRGPGEDSHGASSRGQTQSCHETHDSWWAPDIMGNVHTRTSAHVFMT